MEQSSEFYNKLKTILDDIGEETLSYDTSEFWMYQSPYEYIEFYAQSRQFLNTAIALPLARGLHSRDHRRSTIERDGQSYRLPYLVHPLLVCRMLLDMHIPLSHEDKDILFAAALCHDMIEDLPFEEHGRELVSKYHLDPRVFYTVHKLSKRRDFTEEEEIEFFHSIECDPLALLVKLSDRGNNVEDLYNMSIWKVHEYIGETRKFILPMCTYALKHYPDLCDSISILQDKLFCLTDAAEIFVERYQYQEQKMQERLNVLREENKMLREKWQRLHAQSEEVSHG